MLIENDENTNSTFVKTMEEKDIDAAVNSEKIKQNIFNQTIESYQEEKSFANRAENSFLNCFKCCQGHQNENEKFKKKKTNSKFSKYTRLSFYRNNLSFFGIIIVYIIISIVLIFIQLSIYSGYDAAMKVARTAGMLLNFNCSLIILLVLRRLLTWLRNSFIGTNFLPLDDFIKFHKFIGFFLILITAVHTIGISIDLCILIFLFNNLI